MIVTAKHCKTFDSHLTFLAGKEKCPVFPLAFGTTAMYPTIPECETSTTIVPIEHFEELHQRYNANHHPVSSFFCLVAMYRGISP